MTRLKFMLLLAITIPLGLALYWIFATSRMATETPDYQVVRREGRFEIRDYPALTLARTPMEKRQMNGAFGRLFQFITGHNSSSEKIKMTTPVLIENNSGRKTMSFIISAETVKHGTPKPAGESVTLGQTDAARYACLRFRGQSSEANEKKALMELESWLITQKMTGQGAPIFAYYDPPWTPSFLRRNEVLIPVLP